MREPAWVPNDLIEGRVQLLGKRRHRRDERTGDTQHQESGP